MDQSAHAQALLRHASVGGRRRSARGAGDARPQRHLDYADLHSSVEEPPAQGPSHVPSARYDVEGGQTGCGVELNDPGQFIQQLSIWALPTIFAIILHEVMHGVVARALGDDTAARAGRLTLNPLSHIDPFGTIVLPAILLFLHLPVFGYAKPVPVNFGRLRNGRAGMGMVAVAGPLTNLTLALISGKLAHLLVPMARGEFGHMVAVPLIYMAQASVIINVVLMVFNLLALLPREAARAYSRLEPYGFLILLLLLYTNWVGAIINPIINTLARALL